MTFYQSAADAVFRTLHPRPAGDCFSAQSIFEAAQPTRALWGTAPCYNGEGYLSRMLDALSAQQTAFRYEVIFVDDGSADGTLDLLQRRAKEHPHWRVLTQPNGGTACARNTGMRVSRGEYLMFVDSDDAISSGYIDGLMTAAAAAHADLAACAYESRTEQGRLLRRAAPAGDADRSILNGCPWGKVFRRTLFEHLLFPEGFWFEDTILPFLVFPHVKTLATTDACTYLYRSSASNTTQSALKKARSLDTVYVTDLVLGRAASLAPDGWLRSADCYDLLVGQFYLNHRRLMGQPPVCRKALFKMQAAYLNAEYPDRTGRVPSTSRYERAMRRGSFLAGECAVRLDKPDKLLALIRQKRSHSGGK